MSDTRGLAVQAVALSVLASRVRDRLDDTKAQLAETLDVGDRKTAALDDGRKVGSITFTKGRASARVVDEAALTKWVEENYPHNIVATIRPAFLTLLLDNAKKAGEPVDVHTGEVVPGLQVVDGAPYLSVRPDPAAIPALVDAIRANQVLALDGGETSDAD